MNEKPIVLEGAVPLIGMLHPASGAQETGVLMMVAGGPQYRIGGHRQLVLWARKFSSRGFPVLRFDFSGMGDSYGEYVQFDNVEDDIKTAIDQFFKETPTLKQIVLWGECNACSASLFYAHKDPRIKGIVMLNPWVRTEQGQAKAVVKHYYLDRLKQRSFWVKVFTLKFDFIGSMKSALK
ncbi:MAG: esterase/lipase/thioesterase family protein, partial [uncultured bacterium]